MARKTFLTVSFRLRTPTKRKQAVLDYAFAQYTKEVQRLLDWAQANLETIRQNGRTEKGIYNADSIRPCLPSNTDWQMPLSSSLKDGVFLDACGMIAGYLELEGLSLIAGWPTAEKVVTDEARQRALAEFGALQLLPRDVAELRSDEDVADTTDYLGRMLNAGLERELASDLRRKAFTAERPLTYTRGRDFDLLLTSDLKHPYVYLPLLPNQNSMVDPVDFRQKNMLTLWSNDPTGITPVQAGKKRNGLLLPLELGKRGGRFHWQYRKFIMAMLDGNGTPKAAKVIKRNGHYFVNVSVAFDAPEMYAPVTYMGITDNILYDLSYAIVNLKGEVITTEQSRTGILDLRVDAQKVVRSKQKEGKPVSYLDYKRSSQDEVLHLLINQMLQVAKTHQAGIALMDGEGLRSRRKGKALTRIWEKAEFIIAYKCKMLGIPLRSGVFSAKAAFICARCGNDATICARCGNDATIVEGSSVCTRCGGTVPASLTKAINIARRVFYKKSEWESKGGYRGFHKHFR